MTFLKKAILPMVSAFILMSSPIASVSAESGRASGAHLSLSKAGSLGHHKSYRHGRSYGYRGKQYHPHAKRYYRYNGAYGGGYRTSDPYRYGQRKVYEGPKIYRKTHSNPAYRYPVVDPYGPGFVCHSVNRVVVLDGRKALVGGKACRSGVYGRYSVNPATTYFIKYVDY